MSRSKNNFHFLPVIEGQRSRSLHRDTVLSADKVAIAARYIAANDGNAVMSRAQMSVIADKLWSMAYPHSWLFKNIALRVRDSKLFDLARIKPAVERVKRAKVAKVQVAQVESCDTFDASHALESASESQTLTVTQ